MALNEDRGGDVGTGLSDFQTEDANRGDFESSERETTSGLTKFAKSPFTKTAASLIPGGVGFLAGLKFLGLLDGKSGGDTRTGTSTAGGVPGGGGGTVSALQNAGGGGLTPVPGVDLGGGGNKIENALFGKPGEFSQVPTDPNQQFFSEGQRTIAERFLDPSKDPILQRELRGIGSRLGITAQGAKGALASDAVGAHSARAFDVFNRGFTGTRPITRFQEPGEGLLSALDQIRSGEGGSFFGGSTPDWIRNLNPIGRGERDREEGEGSFFGARTPDFIRNLNPFA